MTDKPWRDHDTHKPIKYYIASRLEGAARVKQLKRYLDDRGWHHTYDWTIHGSVQSEGSDVIRAVAMKETSGVLNADVVVVLLPGGRGTHTELGMAIAANKIIFLLSETVEIDFGGDGRTCCFYHHAHVRRVSSMDELHGALASMERS